MKRQNLKISNGVNIKSKIKQFPSTPGVYLFEDKNNNILYIGKAAALKKRVLSYTQKNLDPRLEEMVSKAHKIRYKKTDSVLEAIILEANLIKKHWPKYNIRERDNRSFVYIVIDTSATYPKPIVIRGREIEKFHSLRSRVKVFGPYKSLSTVQTALRIIRHIFPYSTCSPVFSGAKAGRPCFYYTIGLCPGVCVNKISSDEYRENINSIISMLRGQKKQLIKKLAHNNPGQARALEHISDVSLLTRKNLGAEVLENRMHRIEGYDISHLAGKETSGVMVVFLRGKPDKTQYRLFTIKIAKPHNDLLALEEVITRRMRHSEWQMPDLIVIDGGRPQIRHIDSVLRQIGSSIPIVGISKYGGDTLVFSKNIKKSSKQLIQSMKSTLLHVRDEAHRFAIRFSRTKRKFV